jgi:hypothetical protein
MRIASARIGSVPASAPSIPRSTTGVPDLPETKPPDSRARELVENVTTITEENPRLELQAVAVPDGQRMTLLVTNTSDKLLPFHFNTSQSYDFVVTDEQTGQEVWRWSRRMFFSPVTRSEAIAARKSWKFEVTWNQRDNDSNPLPPGLYEIVGIVTGQSPIETEPVPIEIK